MDEITNLITKLEENMRREFGDGRFWTEEDERKARARERAKNTPFPRIGGSKETSYFIA